MKAIPYTRFVASIGMKLTLAQTAFARVVYDGAEPAELHGAQRDLARKIFGEVDRIPKSARAVLAQVKGRDVGGTRMGAYRVVHLACTINLDRLGLNELAYCFFGAPKLRLSRVAKRFALDAAQTLAERGDIEVENVTADGFTIVRHDGRRVRFECFAASRGGDNIRGVSVIAALMDEAAFYLDESTGVINGRAIFNAIVPRLLPGGQVLIVSSPWGISDLLAEEFQANRGAPETAIAAHCPTLLMRDDSDTIATVARERQRNAENARREFDAEFLTDLATALPDFESCFEPITDRYNWERPFAVGDPAYSGDTYALIMCSIGQPVQEQEYKLVVPPPNSGLTPDAFLGYERDAYGQRIPLPIPDSPILSVYELESWTAPAIRQLGMKQVVEQITHVLRRNHCDTLLQDSHGAPYLAALLSEKGIRLRSFQLSANDKHEAVTLLRSWMRDKNVRITNDSPHSAEFRKQLSRYRRVTMPGGTYKYTGGSGKAVDDWPACLITLGTAMCVERGISTAEQHFKIEGAPTRRAIGGRFVAAGR